MSELRECPDCKCTYIVYRCACCGCQWSETSKTPQENRAIDPRLKEAVKEIEKEENRLYDSQDMENSSVAMGIQWARECFEGTFPELKEEDSCPMDGDDWEGEDDYGYGEVKDE